MIGTCDVYLWLETKVWLSREPRQFFDFSRETSAGPQDDTCRYKSLSLRFV